MSVAQALASALAGVNTTQQSLAVIAGNVANANTPGYVTENVDQVEVGTANTAGASVAAAGVNRDLNTLLQGQLWTETSGGSYADTSAQLYQQLQQIYGTPGSSTSFDAVYNNFTTALQGLSSGPGTYSNQAAVLSSAQALTQNLNSMTTSIQQLRTQAEQGIATDVQTANTALQQIAQINVQLEGATTQDASTATLEDQRDQDITQLAKLMDIRVVHTAHNQVSVFTGTGLQLAGVQASQLAFSNAGTLSATSLWSSDPSTDAVGTVALISPAGTSTDLVADKTIQSGEIAAYLKMRDSILPQAQSQLDEFANQTAQALSNLTAAGTAVTSGGQSGYYMDVGGVLAGNSIQVAYTDSANNPHTITLVSLGQGGSLPLQNSPVNAGNQVVGIDFSHGMVSAVGQLNAALGASLQFSNPSGTILQVVNNNGSPNVVNSLSATSTVTSLTSGNPQLQLFLDGTKAITGAITSSGSQTTGLAGRITVNAAVVAAPSALVAYAANTSSGDPTRPNFILGQMTGASLTFSSTTGIGTSQAPYSGTLTDYMSQVASLQSQAANAATNLQQGQDTVVSALQQRFNDQSGVNIDTEMSNLIALQNTYGANARVMSTVQQMMATLMQVVQ